MTNPAISEVSVKAVAPEELRRLLDRKALLQF